VIPTVTGSNRSNTSACYQDSHKHQLFYVEYPIWAALVAILSILQATTWLLRFLKDHLRDLPSCNIATNDEVSHRELTITQQWQSTHKRLARPIDKRTKYRVTNNPVPQIFFSRVQAQERVRTRDVSKARTRDSQAERSDVQSSKLAFIS
jgi:hypothetical protein